MTELDLSRTSIPLPGLHIDIPFPVYKKWPGTHQSMLKHMAVPAKARYEEDNQKEPTPSMEFGSALHCAVLEPERFAKEYVTHGKVDKRTKAWKDFCDTNFDKLFIHEDVLRMADSIRSLPSLKMILDDAATVVEASASWTDDETGVLCKGRFDIYNRDLETTSDIKTTRSASPDGFALEVFKNGYHIQGALYRRACRILGLPCSDFIFFCVENKAPFCAAAYRLQDEVIDLGEAQVVQYLKRLKECEATGQWPGYSNEILSIGIPSWSFKQLSEEYGE